MATKSAAHLTSRLLILAFLCGCSASPNLWVTDSIAAGSRTFDSSRLRFSPSQAHPQLAFEMVKIGDQIEAFISLNRFRIKKTENVNVLFTIKDQSFEDQVPIHEGGMRLRLSSETTQRLILALQEGHKIGILLDDFEETLDPNQFSSSFAKFIGEGHFFQNLFRGPIQ